MSESETIEEKTYRLMGWLYGAQPPFKSIKQTNDFKLRCQMLELAIAEEREERLKDAERYRWLRTRFDNDWNGAYFELRECVWCYALKQGIELDKAIDAAMTAAPKDEVSE